MAYSYVWPTSLPQSPQKGYSETGGVLVLRSPMDSGPAKQRRRGARPQTMQLSFIMTSAQVAVLENFVEDTLRGTARYGFRHPRTQAMVEVRIVPQSDGVMYTNTYLAPDYWTVSLQLEVLP
jgi:hypothetical protein